MLHFIEVRRSSVDQRRHNRWCKSRPNEEYRTKDKTHHLIYDPESKALDYRRLTEIVLEKSCLLKLCHNLLGPYQHREATWSLYPGGQRQDSVVSRSISWGTKAMTVACSIHLQSKRWNLLWRAWSTHSLFIASLNSAPHQFNLCFRWPDIVSSSTKLRVIFANSQFTTTLYYRC